MSEIAITILFGTEDLAEVERQQEEYGFQWTRTYLRHLIQLSHKLSETFAPTPEFVAEVTSAPVPERFPLKISHEERDAMRETMERWGIESWGHLFRVVVALVKGGSIVIQPPTP